MKCRFKKYNKRGTGKQLSLSALHFGTISPMKEGYRKMELNVKRNRCSNATNYFSEVSAGATPAFSVRRTSSAMESICNLFGLGCILILFLMETSSSLSYAVNIVISKVLPIVLSL
ncbi:MAG: hypothetical protein ACI8PB_003699 [Desulforhopalus sp.]|jgi:hypothetical protein